MRLAVLLCNCVRGVPVPRSAITMQVDNIQKLLSEISKIDSRGREAIKSAVKDTKARAPGWIASEVVKEYNIKKSEIIPSRKNASPKKLAASIRVTGETIEQITINYEGRMLTPTHFSMTPKAPPKGKSYTLKMQVVKGQAKIIGRFFRKRTTNKKYSERSHNILMGTGNTKAGGTNWIPFQRVSKERTDLEKFTAISAPQMITSERTRDAIAERINKGTEERLTHQIKRYLK